MAQTISFPELEPAAVSTEAQDTRILPRNIFASGTLPGNTVIRIGETNLIIDGENSRIMINDGSVDRVLIGRQDNGF